MRAYALLVEHGIPGEAYNVGTGKAYTIQYLLDTLLSYSNIQISIKQDPARMRPSDVPIVFADSSKLRSQTGWEPIFKFEDSLLRVLDYWREDVKSKLKNK